MFYNGLEGCGSSLLITRHGKILDGIATDVGHEDVWSPNGRYVSGVAGDTGLWIADVWRGRIMRRLNITNYYDYSDYAWLNNDRLRVKFYPRDKSRNPKSITKILRVP